MDTTIELSLSPNYVGDWTVLDAIRELLQNALDSDGFKVTYSDQVLTISNNGNLKRETILLGNSTKASDKTKIGQFGEGYKIALLVLCREGYKPIINIHSNYRLEIWKPYIEHSNNFNSDVLKIDISDTASDVFSDKVDFSIDGFPEELYKEVSKNSIPLRTTKTESIDTYLGQILTDPDERGRIYINGLFVCKSTNDKISHGYNVKPAYLKLDRDRKLVADFDLFWTTSTMWVEAKEHREIAVDNIIKEKPDVQYALSVGDTNSLDDLAAATHQKVQEMYGNDVIVVKSQEQLERLVDDGNDQDNIKYIPERTYDMVVRSKTYSKPQVKKRPKLDERDPSEVLNWFYDKWGHKMSSEMEQDFDLMLTTSANWQNNVIDDGRPF